MRQSITRIPRAAVPLTMLLACAAPRTQTPDSPAARTDSAVASSRSAGEAVADTSGPVALRTDASRYRPGARLALTLVNRADARYAFNPCTRLIEREVDGTWRPVEEPGRLCTMEAWLLEPRATRTATMELPSSLGAGRYRLVVLLTREGTPPPAEHTRAVSAPFDVSP